MKFAIFIIMEAGILTCSPCALAASSFTPSTLFSEQVTPRAHYDRHSRQFTYSYKVSNAPSSNQGISLFGVIYSVDDLSEIKSPTSWMNDSSSGELPLTTWTTNMESEVRPGHSKSNFQFSSANQPTISKYYTRSSFEWLPMSHAEMDEVAESGLLEFERNSKQGLTVGPGTPPSTDPVNALANIGDLQGQCVSQNWIANNQSLKLLTKDLAEIKVNLANHNNERARYAILTYSHDLQTFRRGSVNITAETLLHASVEYLMSLMNCRDGEDNFKDDDDGSWHEE